MVSIIEIDNDKDNAEDEQLMRNIVTPEYPDNPFQVLGEVIFGNTAIVRQFEAPFRNSSAKK